MRPIQWWTGILVGCLLGAVAGRADNPPVTLRLDRATLPEAVAALSRASGVTLRVDEEEIARDRQSLTERVSFVWDGVPLAQTMRDLSRQFRVQPRRAGDTFVFGTAVPVRPSPDGAWRSSTRNGVRVEIRRIVRTEVRRGDGTQGTSARASGTDRLTLMFTVTLAGRDADQVAGLAHVTARDEFGNILGPHTTLFAATPAEDRLTRYPDEWECLLRLPGPDPRARRLTWLEGFLVVRADPSDKVDMGGRGAPFRTVGAPGRNAKPGIRNPVNNSEPETRSLRLEAPFRLEQVPLPEQPRLTIPVTVAALPPDDLGPGVPRGRTATLICPVRVGNAPARDGVVALGLARREGAGWAAVRWVEREVDPGGWAAVQDLEPGRYRVRRTYITGAGADAVNGPAPRTPERFSRPGTLLEVELREGREVVLTPLRVPRLSETPVQQGNGSLVTLQLERVTATEAVQALRRSAGPLVLLEDEGTASASAGGGMGLSATLPPPSAGARASFHWTGASPAAAVRELAAAFDYDVVSMPPGYLLRSRRAREWTGWRTVQHGLHFSLPGAGWSLAAARSFRRANFTRDLGRTLMLGLGVHEPGFGAERIARVEELRVRVGSVRAGAGARDLSYPHTVRRSEDAPPGRWEGLLSTDAPDVPSPRLAGLEGTVVLFRRVRPRRIVATVPPGAAPVLQAVAPDLAFEFSRLPGLARPESETSRASDAPVRGPELRLRMLQEVRPDVEWVLRSTLSPRLLPVALGRSGRVFLPDVRQSRPRRTGERLTVEHDLVFPGMQEPLERLVWDLLERADSTRAVPFRLTNLPLPARVGVLFPSAGGAEESDSPAMRGGRWDNRAPSFLLPALPAGTLACRVDVPREDGSSGVLRVGLARVEGEVWEPLTWITIPVATDGNVRLPPLRPGRYRVIRVYRLHPRASASLPAAIAVGHFEHGEVLARVKPGQVTHLPPLRWIRESNGRR